MSNAGKSYYALLKENAELRKELARYKAKENTPIKKINIKLSHNNFYRSSEWRELRYKKLVSHIQSKGRVCECCKSNTNKLHVDHIKPRSIRPDLELDITNLQVLCDVCNVGKSNVDATDWSKLNDNEWDF